LATRYAYNCRAGASPADPFEWEAGALALQASSRKLSDWVILVVLDRREPRRYMIKRAIKRAPKKGKFAVGEHIRVVPLHQPIVAAPPQAT